MTRVGNVDQLVLLLRERLLERAKAGASSKTAAQRTASREPSAIQAMAALEGIDDGTLRRAFIQDVLAEHFGRHLINDANFQQVVDRVTSALSADPAASAMFEQITAALRQQARA